MKYLQFWELAWRSWARRAATHSEPFSIWEECSFRWHAHGSTREEGDTCLVSQISCTKPGDWQGDSFHSQIIHSLVAFCLNLHTGSYLMLSKQLFFLLSSSPSFIRKAALRWPANLCVFICELGNAYACGSHRLFFFYFFEADSLTCLGFLT